MRTFKSARTFATDVETRPEHGKAVTYDNMTIAGLVPGGFRAGPPHSRSLLKPLRCQAIRTPSQSQTAAVAVALTTLSLHIMYLKNLLETGSALHASPPTDQILKDTAKELQTLRLVGITAYILRT